MCLCVLWQGSMRCYSGGTGLRNISFDIYCVAWTVKRERSHILYEERQYFDINDTCKVAKQRRSVIEAIASYGKKCARVLRGTRIGSIWNDEVTAKQWKWKRLIAWERTNYRSCVLRVFDGYAWVGSCVWSSFKCHIRLLVWVCIVLGIYEY